MPDHVPLELLVVGTGRSGTQRAARLLTDAGLRCSHERVFTPAGIRPAEHPAESSWLAVPLLNQLHPAARPRRGIVLTYREPELVVGSFLGVGFFTEDRHRPFRDYAITRIPELGVELRLRGPQAAAEHWYRWMNRTALRHASLVMHVADVPRPELAELAGLDLLELAVADRRLGRVGSRRRHPIDRHDLDPATVDVWHTLKAATDG